VEKAIKDGAQALLALHDYSAHGERFTGEQVVRLANEKRVPAIFGESELVDAGGLMSLATNRLDDVGRAADILAQVLRGAKPAEIPVDQASRFELAVNLRTARAIGIQVPASILVRADRVIE
jgi:putative ABC transport system substrate-binding protein